MSTSKGIPLYRGCDSHEQPADGHIGLWHDKFFSRWNGSDWSLPPNAKSDWVADLCKGFRESRRDHLLEACLRVVSLAEATGGVWFTARSSDAFVTGLGRAHPIENGLTVHQTLSAPFIPGSSLKGVLRAHLLEESPTADVAALLGQAGRRGRVAILDALPGPCIQLEPDVMTPHHTLYYSGKGPPADWHDPTPIPFVVVSPGAAFLFAVIPLDPAGPSGKALAGDVAVKLQAALRDSGAGAKTAVGYGRFERDEGLEGNIRRKQGDRDQERKRLLLETLPRRDRWPLRVDLATELERLDLITRHLGEGRLEDEEERASLRRALRETPDYDFWKENERARDLDLRIEGKAFKRRYLNPLREPREAKPASRPLDVIPEPYRSKLEVIEGDKGRLRAVVDEAESSGDWPEAALEELPKMARRILPKVKKRKPADGRLYDRIKALKRGDR